jgi:DHA2 family multidrug resistance protein
MASLRALPGPEVAKGAGLYNLFRMLGGSLGIAMLTTVLDTRAELHRTGLADQVGPLDPVGAQTLASITRAMSMRGADAETAQTMATAVLGRLVDAQASLEAFSDAYALIGVLFILMLPLGFMIARHAPGKHAPIE